VGSFSPDFLGAISLLCFCSMLLSDLEDLMWVLLGVTFSRDPSAFFGRVGVGLAPGVALAVGHAFSSPYSSGDVNFLVDSDDLVVKRDAGF